ncbi:MAG TPA: SagB/ThcOx family dehydrogenase [Sedimentisphaerales bacterium]|nr:SagB/ThcOx family dehydrogenase [Sedimentisphaerales bacterium]
MKKLVILLVAAATVAAYGTATVVEGIQGTKEAVEPNTPAAEVRPVIIALEKPDMTGGMPLMMALKNRRSDRAFSEQELSKRQLSEVLWAANGVNRDDGKRTVPSAMDRRLMDVYAVLADGIYFYDPQKHALVLVAEGDLRAYTGTQPFVRNAPLNLVFVADLSRFNDPRRPGREIPHDLKMQWATLEAGCQVQNVYLYCASEGLATVVRGMVDRERLAPLMKLRDEQVIICAQTVGLPR